MTIAYITGFNTTLDLATSAGKVRSTTDRMTGRKYPKTVIKTNGRRKHYTGGEQPDSNNYVNMVPTKCRRSNKVVNIGSRRSHIDLPGYACHSQKHSNASYCCQKPIKPANKFTKRPSIIDSSSKRGGKAS
ncbi:hypothetical protein AC249_AIPGENE11031 [Exaiptasia diaphana]|nr:hypothetical protein AC249_AIPGENE11031 [Exaiptasia diaphana]